MISAKVWSPLPRNRVSYLSATNFSWPLTKSGSHPFTTYNSISSVCSKVSMATYYGHNNNVSTKKTYTKIKGFMRWEETNLAKLVDWESRFAVKVWPWQIWHSFFLKRDKFDTDVQLKLGLKIIVHIRLIVLVWKLIIRIVKIKTNMEKRW